LNKTRLPLVKTVQGRYSALILVRTKLRSRALRETLPVRWRRSISEVALLEVASVLLVSWLLNVTTLKTSLAVDGVIPEPSMTAVLSIETLLICSNVGPKLSESLKQN